MSSSTWPRCRRKKRPKGGGRASSCSGPGPPCPQSTQMGETPRASDAAHATDSIQPEQKVKRGSQDSSADTVVECCRKASLDSESMTVPPSHSGFPLIVLVGKFNPATMLCLRYTRKLPRCSCWVSSKLLSWTPYFLLTGRKHVPSGSRSGNSALWEAIIKLAQRCPILLCAPLISITAPEPPLQRAAEVLWLFSTSTLLRRGEISNFSWGLQCQALATYHPTRARELLFPRPDRLEAPRPAALLPSLCTKSPPVNTGGVGSEHCKVLGLKA